MDSVPKCPGLSEPPGAMTEGPEPGTTAPLIVPLVMLERTPPLRVTVPTPVAEPVVLAATSVPAESVVPPP